MNNPDDNAETGVAKKAVLVRFFEEELAQMREITGAMADATAVACYVRNNLRKDNLRKASA